MKLFYPSLVVGPMFSPSYVGLGFLINNWLVFPYFLCEMLVRKVFFRKNQVFRRSHGSFSVCIIVCLIPDLNKHFFT